MSFGRRCIYRSLTVVLFAWHALAWPIERVLEKNFADPAVISTPQGVYLYATRGNGKNIQIARVEEGGAVRWLDRDAMPQLAPWVKRATPKTWAPYVLALGGRYLMYYTARYAAGDRQCIGVAVSDTTVGPFIDANPLPLVCPLADGGAIDPAVFTHAGERYLLWKNDGNCCGLPTRIYAQRLTADGLGLASMPVVLIENDRADEEGIVEAPEMIAIAGRLYLLYSSARFGQASYRTDHAVCDSPLGPCRKIGPLLQSGERDGLTLVGPGSPTLLTRDGRTEIYFHGWRDARARQSGERFLYRGRLRANGWQLILE